MQFPVINLLESELLDQLDQLFDALFLLASSHFQHIFHLPSLLNLKSIFPEPRFTVCAIHRLVDVRFVQEVVGPRRILLLGVEGAAGFNGRGGVAAVHRREIWEVVELFLVVRRVELLPPSYQV